MTVFAINESERNAVRKVFDTAANPKVVQKGPVASITRVGTTATATRPKHGYQNGQTVTISGADQADYNGAFAISNVTADTFDYTVANSPATPATGTIYASDEGQSVWVAAPKVAQIESIAGATTVKMEVAISLALGWVQFGSDLTSADNGKMYPLDQLYNFFRFRRSAGSGAVKAHVQM